MSPKPKYSPFAPTGKPSNEPIGILPPNRAKVLDEAIARTIQKWARPYQVEWLLDDAHLKAGVSCRQAGKSRGWVALEAVLKSFEPRVSPEHDENIVSASQGQSDDLIRKATEWLDLIDPVTRKLGGFSVYRREPTKSVLEVYTGKRIRAFPANPRTIAGSTGDVWLDELSKMMHDELVWEAAVGVTRANPGYVFRATGTYWGDRGVFFNVMRGNDPQKRGFSLHKVDVYRAVRDGATIDIEETRGMLSSAQWQQDYECIPLAAENEAVPREVREAIQLLRLPDYRDERGRDLPGVRRIIGVDVGRTNDLFAVVWLVEYPTGMYRVEQVMARRKMRFADQRRVLQSILGYGRGGTTVQATDTEYAYVHAAAIDAKGLGMQLAEEIRDDFPAVVRCIQWSDKSKEQCISGMIALMSTGHVQVEPRFEGVLNALAALRREFVGSGGIRYDAVSTDEGHADEAVALALAVERAAAGAGNWGLSTEDRDFGLDNRDHKSLDVPTRSGILHALGTGEQGAWTADDLGVTRHTEEDLRKMRQQREEGWSDDDL